MTDREISVIDAAGWADRTPAEILDFLETLPLVDGIAETVPPTSTSRTSETTPDLPLFAEVGLAIAVNATPAARAAAHRAVDTTDLRAVLPHLEAWLR